MDENWGNKLCILDKNVKMALNILFIWGKKGESKIFINLLIII